MICYGLMGSLGGFVNIKNIYDKPKEIKGKFIDKDAHKIQFSGFIFDKEIKLDDDTFFCDKNSNTYTVASHTKGSALVKTGVAFNKSEKNYEVTDVVYVVRKLELR